MSEVAVATGASAGVARAVAREFARHGASVGLVESQQIADEPLDPDRPANLWQPLGGDEGAHGRFDGDAKARSVQPWATRHHRSPAAGAVAAGLRSR